MTLKWKYSDWGIDNYRYLLFDEAIRADWKGAVDHLGGPDETRTPEELEVLRTYIQQRPVYRQDILDRVASGIPAAFEKHFGFDEKGKPATTLLVRSVIFVGAGIAIYAADKYRRQRPAQRDPSLVTPGNKIIDSPTHPSYPNGYSLQGQLAALSLDSVGLNLVPLTALARSLALDREIAGVNYPTDSAAGELLAPDVWSLIREGSLFRSTQEKAIREWK